MPDDNQQPRVGIVMGSDSDWPVMSAAGLALHEFGVAFEADVVSAHRMTDAMISYGRTAHSRGLEVIIAGAGGAAHLPGMLAAVTPLPVIGVPVPLKYLDGMDSLLSIVQMPAGVPVAAVAIGNARNAGLLAVRILAAGDPGLRQQMLDFQDQLRRAAEAKGATVRADAQNLVSEPLVQRDGAVSGNRIGDRCRVADEGSEPDTRRPRMFLLGAIPPAITSVIFTGLLIALITQLEPLVEWLTPFADGWTRGLATTVRVLIGTALGAGAVLIMVISFTTLTLALGSPLYDKLSESVEREFGDVPELDENVARGLATGAAAGAGADRGRHTRGANAVRNRIRAGRRTDCRAGTLGDLRRLDAGDRTGRGALRTPRAAAAVGSACRDAGTTTSSPRLRGADLSAPRHPVRGGRGISGGHSRRHPTRPSTPRRAHVK